MDQSKSSPASGGSWKAIAGTALSAFLLGALLVGYVAWKGSDWLGRDSASRVEIAAATGKPRAGATPSPSPSASANAATRAATAMVERVEETQGGIDQRLAAAEQRISRLDLQTQAASGNAARAEGLLIAFAARRTLERGAELGYLADQLRLRFGDALPNAVDTVIAASRDPVTLDQLIARLENLSPKLAHTTEGLSVARFRREISELFVVRRASAPSPQPERRLERARWFLESGRTEAAIEEVRNMPGAENAASWITDARRYADAQRALDLIETSAVLEPRRLRDRAGQPIEQPSPAQATR